MYISSQQLLRKLAVSSLKEKGPLRASELKKCIEAHSQYSMFQGQDISNAVAGLIYDRIIELDKEWKLALKEH